MKTKILNLIIKISSLFLFLEKFGRIKNLNLAIILNVIMLFIINLGLTNILQTFYTQPSEISSILYQYFRIVFFFAIFHYILNIILHKLISQNIEVLKIIPDYTETDNFTHKNKNKINSKIIHIFLLQIIVSLFLFYFLYINNYGYIILLRFIYMINYFPVLFSLFVYFIFFLTFFSISFILFFDYIIAATEYSILASKIVNQSILKKGPSRLSFIDYYIYSLKKYIAKNKSDELFKKTEKYIQLLKSQNSFEREVLIFLCILKIWNIFCNDDKVITKKVNKMIDDNNDYFNVIDDTNDRNDNENTNDIIFPDYKFLYNLLKNDSNYNSNIDNIIFGIINDEQDEKLLLDNIDIRGHQMLKEIIIAIQFIYLKRSVKEQNYLVSANILLRMYNHHYDYYNDFKITAQTYPYNFLYLFKDEILNMYSDIEKYFNSKPSLSNNYPEVIFHTEMMKNNFISLITFNLKDSS